MAKPYFLPWRGNHYDNSPQRLLILGESHYSEENLRPDATIEFLRQYTTGEWRHRYWTNIMQTVSGKPHSAIDRAAFYDGVAFYNYVQQTVASGPNIAPKSEMFTSSEPAFFSVLNELKPKNILVLSTRLWANLPSVGRPGPSLQYDGKSRDSWLYRHQDGEALASWIPHPSRFFRWQRWAPLASALLATQNDMAGLD